MNFEPVPLSCRAQVLLTLRDDPNSPFYFLRLASPDILADDPGGFEILAAKSSLTLLADLTEAYPEGEGHVWAARALPALHTILDYDGCAPRARPLLPFYDALVEAHGRALEKTQAAPAAGGPGGDVAGGAAQGVQQGVAGSALGAAHGGAVQAAEAAGVPKADDAGAGWYKLGRFVKPGAFMPLQKVWLNLN